MILPFTVLRRLECVLEPTKDAVLAEKAKREKAGLNPEPFLLKKSGGLFYNTSPLDLKKLMGDQDNIGENLRAYMQAFSPAVRDIFESFDYMLSNPPFGVEWKKIQKEIKKEHTEQGYNGRFGPGLPRVSNGSLLFLMHLIAKMRPARDGGSRFGIVLNGSPLFTGGAGSGESEIRRYVLENDLVEAIIGLPTDMFYNTGISTYVWIVSNRKPAARKGKVQLIDASGFWQKMRKSLGSKRKELSPEHIEDITRLFGDFEECTREGLPISRTFKNEDFGYRTITVDRPQRDEAGKTVKGMKGKAKGKPVPDSSLRDTENVPLTEDVQAYFEREVLPHAPDAWIDESKTKVGYEIPFNRHFYVFKPPRPLDAIDADLTECTGKILKMIEGLSGEVSAKEAIQP